MATPLRRTAAALFLEKTGTTLDQWLADEREKGTSLRTMADRLCEKTDGAVDVSAQTVLNWVNDTAAAA